MTDQAPPHLVVGSEVIPLENDRYYAIKLPPDASHEDLERTAQVLASLRLTNPERAPRFLICQREVDIEQISAYDAVSDMADMVVGDEEETHA